LLKNYDYQNSVENKNSKINENDKDIKLKKNRNMLIKKEKKNISTKEGGSIKFNDNNKLKINRIVHKVIF
jgi:hypothetical protein